MNVCNALSRLISQQDTHRDDDIASDGSDTSPTEMSRGDVGTTLLEVLVVLVILGFVAQVTVPRVYFILANAKGKLAMQQVDALGNALEVYRVELH
jgi:prepilin-type N-terminal cleavage/methylation domain-containing protein